MIHPKRPGDLSHVPNELAIAVRAALTPEANPPCYRDGTRTELFDHLVGQREQR
jgi:hypothetical protein